METPSYNLSNNAEAIKSDILFHLFYTQGRTTTLATMHDWYMAVAYTLRSRLMKNWIDALTHYKDHEKKIVGYLSAEFLMGPHLGNAIVNLDIYQEVSEALTQLDLDINAVLQQEVEPGLGNGGLGRLAACYLDSMTTLQVPAIGYGIRYEFGIFEQQIQNGQQIEITDKWLQNGNPWEIVQHNITYKIKFGGYTQTVSKPNGQYEVQWIAQDEVKGIAYDTPVPGYKNNAINLLRLWKAEAFEALDLSAFNHGNYGIAVQKKTWAETISKVLYPNDETEDGKRLRLMQQYFFVSCSLQNVIGIQLQRNKTLHDLPQTFALQLNDTHPAISIAEMMRLLVDEHQMWWDEAWKITQAVFSYTNHTLLPEALEKWPLQLFTALLPRHIEIIYEINSRFLESVAQQHPGNNTLLSNLSIIDETGGKAVRMAHLASIGSHTINGVSQLHSKLLKEDLLADFAKIKNKNIINVTNGVTPRRWMALNNPMLAKLISDYIGNAWIGNTQEQLRKLEAFINDDKFITQWQKVKLENKRQLAHLILQRTGIAVNPKAMFDVQVKRIHEYKRQHLCVLHIIHLYLQLKSNPKLAIQQRVFIFGGKAAPGYVFAKLIIRLINSVADVINNDSDINERIKVVFFPNYSVKNSEWVYRAADLSEQVSTAGKEASGTGNMKFALNGALTIGTLDGANVEMREAVGAENFFLFGLDAGQVGALKHKYSPQDFYQNNKNLKAVIDAIAGGTFSDGNTALFAPIVDSLKNNDPYMLCADFQAYIDCQQDVNNLYEKPKKWAQMSILNVARMGYFSSDRSIADYCKNVWHIDL